MHELSLSSAIVNTVVKHAAGRPGERREPARRRAAPGGAGHARLLLRVRRAGDGLRGRAARAGAGRRRGCAARPASASGRSTMPMFMCPACGGAGRGRGRERRRVRGRVDRGRGGGMHRTKVKIVEEALDANNTIAQANRADFDRAGVRVVNFMSAPGAGKTALLERVVRRAAGRAGGRARGRRAGVDGRRPAGRAARAGDPAQHRPELRRRVPPRREHGALGAAGAAARRDRPARDRERGQPRLPGRVQGRRGRAHHGLGGHRGRGEAAQVPAHVPRLRAGAGQQDRPAAAPRLRPRQVPLQPRRRASRRGAHAREREDRRGHRASGGTGSRGSARRRRARRV